MGSVFLLGVPVMVLLLVVGPRLLPEYRDPRPGRLDLLSAALSLVAVLAVIYGLKRIAQDGLSWPRVLFIVAGLARRRRCSSRRQLRLADPLIDLRLFRVPAFSASLATYGLAILVSFGGFLFMPQYLQLVLGLSPLRAGLWTLPWASAFVVGSMLTPVLVRRVRPASVMAGRPGRSPRSASRCSRASTARPGSRCSSSGSTMFSLGLAPVFTLTTDLIVGGGAARARGRRVGDLGDQRRARRRARASRCSAASAPRSTAAMIDDALPPGVPAEAAEAAQGTLGARDPCRGARSPTGRRRADGHRAGGVRERPAGCARRSAAASLVAGGSPDLGRRIRRAADKARSLPAPMERRASSLLSLQPRPSSHLDSAMLRRLPLCAASLSSPRLCGFARRLRLALSRAKGASRKASLTRPSPASGRGGKI